MALTREGLKNKVIGVLLGGLSEERDVSLKTGAAVAGALAGRGYRVVSVDAGRDAARRIAEAGVDVAWLALHGRWGEDGCIQGLLESMFIPYTGSGVLASAAAMDKIFSKKIFAAAGLPLAEWKALPRGAPAPTSAEAGFGLPCVVKPSREGSSVGVHIVHVEADMAPAVADAAKYNGQVLVERFVPGREIQVAVLFDRALGAIEVRPAREFYDYAAKYTAGTTQYLYPAPLPPSQYREAMELGLAAHRSLACEGATRTDLRLTPEGKWAVLEVNTLPGMTEASLLPKIAAGEGIDYAELCEQLLCSASLKA